MRRKINGEKRPESREKKVIRELLLNPKRNDGKKKSESKKYIYRAIGHVTLNNNNAV